MKLKLIAVATVLAILVCGGSCAHNKDADNNNSDETFSFPKPANMAEAVQEMRTEVLREGGTFEGNETEGTYTFSGITGSYIVVGDMLTVSQRSTGNQMRGSPQDSGFEFSFDIPGNINQTLQLVQSAIEADGGTFEGDEQQGSFRGIAKKIFKITGQYSITDKVNISISDYPKIPGAKSQIEKEIRSYFNGN